MRGCSSELPVRCQCQCHTSARFLARLVANQCSSDEEDQHHLTLLADTAFLPLRFHPLPIVLGERFARELRGFADNTSYPI
jgi:hypothetical protein